MSPHQSLCTDKSNTGRWTSGHADTLTGRQAGKKTDRPRERRAKRKRQAERTGRQADGWMDKHRQIDEWTGRYMNGHTRQAGQETDRPRERWTDRKRQAG